MKTPVSSCWGEMATGAEMRWLMLALSRSRRSQPARGSLRQRPPAARRCETEDCRARAARSAALRHQPPAEGLPWMRLKNPLKVHWRKIDKLTTWDLNSTKNVMGLFWQLFTVRRDPSILSLCHVLCQTLSRWRQRKDKNSIVITQIKPGQSHSKLFMALFPQKI